MEDGRGDVGQAAARAQLGLARGEAFAAMYDEHIPLEDDQAYPQARAALDAASLQAMSADMAARRGLR